MKHHIILVALAASLNAQDHLVDLPHEGCSRIVYEEVVLSIVPNPYARPLTGTATLSSDIVDKPVYLMDLYFQPLDKVNGVSKGYYVYMSQDLDTWTYSDLYVSPTIYTPIPAIGVRLEIPQGSDPFFFKISTEVPLEIQSKPSAESMEVVLVTAEGPNAYTTIRRDDVYLTVAPTLYDGGVRVYLERAEHVLLETEYFVEVSIDGVIWENLDLWQANGLPASTWTTLMYGSFTGYQFRIGKAPDPIP